MEPAVLSRTHQASKRHIQNITDIKEKQSAPVPLLELPVNPTKRLFNLAVEKGILSADGQYIFDKYPPFSELNSESLNRLFQAFRQLGIAEALLHTISKLEKLGIDVNNIISICGSGVLFVLGEEYVAARLNDVGLNIYDIFTRDELNEIFKKAADLDVRFDLRNVKPPVTNEILKELGQGMRGFIETNKTSSKIFVKGGSPWDKPVDLGFARCYALSVENATEVVDVFFGAEMPTDYLSAYDNCFLPLSKETLQAFASNNTQEIEKIKIVPFGIECTGIRALILRMSGCWIADKLGSVDFRGALKFLISFADGRKPLHEETIDKLFGKFFSLLDCDKSKYAMKELHRALNNHFLKRPAAHISVFFNTLKLLFSKLSKENRMSDWKKLKDKVLSPPAQIMKWETSKVSSVFEALLNLLKSDKISFDVVSSYLVLQIQLLANRTKTMGQNADVKVFKDTLCHEEIVMLTLEEPGTTLQLSADILSVLSTLSQYFKNSPFDKEISKSLQALCHPFFRGLEAEFPRFKNEEYSLEAIETIKKMAPFAEQLLESSYQPLKLLGFLLLCQCGTDILESTYLPLLSDKLFDLIAETGSPAQCIAILRHFLQYLERCRGNDCLFHDRTKINDLIKKKEHSSLPLECCITLSSSNSKDIASAILKFIQKEPYKTFMPHAKAMINKYLDMSEPAPSLALRVLKTLAENKQISYEDLDFHLNKIYSSYSTALNLYADLNRMAKVAHLLLTKKGFTDSFGPGTRVYFLIANELLKKNQAQDAIALVDAAEKAGAFKEYGKALYETRLKISLNYAKEKQWPTAMEQWIKAIQHFNALPCDSGADPDWLIEPLLKINPTELSPDAFELWRQALLECATDKLPAATAQRLLTCLSKAFVSVSANENFISQFQKKGSWLLKQIQECSKNDDTLNIYFNLANSLDDSEERKIADSILGPHCFRAFIAKQHNGAFLSPEKEVIALAKEMLNANSPLVQVCGFALLCQLEKSQESKVLLTDVVKAFPNLLISDECIDKRQLIFDQLVLFLEKCAPEFIPKQQLMKLSHHLRSDSSKDAICQSFCLAFSTTNACDTVFNTWQKIESKISIDTGMKLVECYQDKHPVWALKIMAALAQQGNLSVTEKAGNFWSNFLLYYKKNPEDLAKNLLNLTEIAKSMIARVGIKGNVINKSEFGADICWLIEQLLIANENEAVIALYDAAESKKLFPEISTSNSLWLNLCSQLCNSNKKSKAYALCKLLLPKNTNDVINWLLQQPTDTFDAVFIELMLSCISKTSDINQGLLLTQRIINFLNMGKDKKASEGLHKGVKNNLDSIFSTLYRGLEEHQEKSPEIICNLFALLPYIGLDVSSVINSQKFWPILHNQLQSEITKLSFLPLCKQLINSPDTHSKEKCSEKAKVYFLLAKDRDITTDFNTSLKCYEIGINSLDEQAQLEDDEFKLFITYFTEMLNRKLLNEATQFLEQMKRLPQSFKSDYCAKLWGDLIHAAIIQSPLTAAKILLEKITIFSKLNLIDNFSLPGSLAALHLLELQKPAARNQALKLASNYNIISGSFWIKALPHFIKNNLLETEIISILSIHKQLFLGSEEERLNCWIKLLESLADKQCKHFIPSLLHFTAHIFKYQKIDTPFYHNTLRLLFFTHIKILADSSVKTNEKNQLSNFALELNKKCASIEKSEEFDLYELKFMEWQLTTVNEIELQEATKKLLGIKLNKNTHFNTLYLNLVHTTLKAFFQLNLICNSGIGDLLTKIVFNNRQHLDIALVFRFEALQESDHYGVALKFLDPNQKIKNKKLNKEQKFHVEMALRGIFTVLGKNKSISEIEHLLSLLTDTELVTPEFLGVQYRTFMEINFEHCLGSMGTIGHAPLLIIPFDLCQTYLQYIPHIVQSNLPAFKLHELAVKVIWILKKCTIDQFKLSSKFSLYSFIPLSFIEILTEMIHKLLKLEYPDSLDTWNNGLDTLLIQWDCALKPAETNKNKEDLYFYEFTTPVLKTLIEQTKIREKSTDKGLVKNRHLKSSFINGQHLHDFLLSVINQLIPETSTSVSSQDVNMTIIFFYLHICISFFPMPKKIGSRLTQLLLNNDFRDRHGAHQKSLFKIIYGKLNILMKIPLKYQYAISLLLEIEIKVPEEKDKVAFFLYCAGDIIDKLCTTPSKIRTMQALQILNSYSLAAIEFDFALGRKWFYLIFEKALHIEFKNSLADSVQYRNFIKKFGDCILSMKNNETIASLIECLMPAVMDPDGSNHIIKFIDLLKRIYSKDKNNIHIHFHFMKRFNEFLKGFECYSAIGTEDVFRYTQELTFNYPAELERHIEQYLDITKGKIAEEVLLRHILMSNVVVYNYKSLVILEKLFTRYVDLFVDMDQMSYQLFIEKVYLMSSLPWLASDSLFSIKLRLALYALEKMVCIMIKNDPNERQQFYTLLTCIPIKDNETNSQMVNIYKLFISALLKYRYFDEIDAILNSDGPRKLFFNSQELLQPLAHDLFKEFSSSSRNFSSRVAFPKDGKGSFFLINQLGLSGYKSKHLEFEEISRWQSYGKFLVYETTIESEESAAILTKYAIRYFAFMALCLCPTEKPNDKSLVSAFTALYENPNPQSSQAKIIDEKIKNSILIRHFIRKNFVSAFQFLMGLLLQIEDLPHMKERSFEVLKIYEFLGIISVTNLGCKKQFFLQFRQYYLKHKVLSLEIDGVLQTTHMRFMQIFCAWEQNVILQNEDKYLNTEEALINHQYMLNDLFFNNPEAYRVIYQTAIKRLISNPKALEFEGRRPLELYLDYLDIKSPTGIQTIFHVTSVPLWEWLGKLIVSPTSFPLNEPFFNLRAELLDHYFTTMMDLYEKKATVEIQLCVCSFLIMSINDMVRLPEFPLLKETIRVTMKKLQNIVKSNNKEYVPDFASWHANIMLLISS